MNNQFIKVLLGLFKNPKSSFKISLENNFEKQKYILILLSGISILLDNAVKQKIGDHFGTIEIMIYIFALGPVFGFVWVYLLSAMLKLGGKIIKGRANIKDISTVITLSAVPIICMIFFNTLNYIVFGSQVFTSSLKESDFGNIQKYIYFAGYIANLLLMFYYLMLFITGISLIQKFSVFKSVMNIIISILIIMIPLIVIVLIISNWF